MHLLLDLDGTLTDSKPGIVASIRYALKKMETDIGDDVDLELFIGPPLRDVFRNLCGDHIDVELAMTVYRERFATIGIFENSVYPGIQESLEKLSSHVDSMMVATSKPTVYAQRIIAHFGLDSFFRAIYGSHLDGRLGNKVELLEYLLQQENLSADDVIMIGDRKFDMIGARENSISSLGVLWGYGSETELREAGADDLCSRPEELCSKLLKKIQPDSNR